MDNVKYCGYCDHHFSRINKKLVKTIPAFRPVPNDDLSPVPRSATQITCEVIFVAKIHEELTQKQTQSWKPISDLLFFF